ncbi:MAG: hypothetical protein ABSD67_00300 [Terracidiphilus sp.]
MRKILFRFGWLMLAIAGPAHAKTPMRPFTLTIRAEKQQVKAGDPVDIDVVMTNTSDHDVDCTTVSSNGLDRNYQYDVVDEGGQHVPEIEKKHHGGSSFWPCILEPGKTDTPSGGRISILYDLSRPGKYSIQVSRAVWGDNNRPGSEGKGDNKQAPIKSNIITITVLAGDDPRPAQQ